MNNKLKQVGKYWGSTHQAFTGYGAIDVAELRPFERTHPSIMESWLAQFAEQEFRQDPNYRLSRRDRRNRIRFWLENVFGTELSKKHFKRVD